jgi:hypothetical protein
MSRREWIRGALSGAAPVLLACVLLASPAWAAGFVANLVTPPVPWDGGNRTAGSGPNDSIALPQCGGTPGIANFFVCVGGANDGQVPCSSNADCTPACEGYPGTTCASDDDCGVGSGVDCLSGFCAGSCINNFLTNFGGNCQDDSNCLGSPGVCLPAAYSDGITTGDTPTGSDAVNGLKSTCSVNGTAVAASVTFASNTVGTPLGVSTCSSNADCAGNLCVIPAGKTVGKCTGHCQGGNPNLCNTHGIGTKAPTFTCTAGALNKISCESNYDCLCTKNADCGKDTDKFPGTCLDGSEYILSVDGIIGSNADDSPSCSGQDCRVGSGGACIKKICVGGPNAGGPCDPKAIDHGFSSCNIPSAACLAGRCSNGQSVCQKDSDCQGAIVSCTTDAECGTGTCSDTTGDGCTSDADCETFLGYPSTCIASVCNGKCTNSGCLLPPVTLTGDEVGFNFGPVKAFVLCPFAFRLDFPGEAKAGKMSIKSDVSKTALGVVDPSGINAHVTKCELHEPGASDITELGLFTGTAAEVIDGAVEPSCPGLLLPLGGPTLGQAINSGHGPVIGISGGQQK